MQLQKSPSLPRSVPPSHQFFRMSWPSMAKRAILKKSSCSSVKISIKVAFSTPWQYACASSKLYFREALNKKHPGNKCSISISSSTIQALPLRIFYEFCWKENFLWKYIYYPFLRKCHPPNHLGNSWLIDHQLQQQHLQVEQDHQREQDW